MKVLNKHIFLIRHPILKIYFPTVRQRGKNIFSNHEENSKTFAQYNKIYFFESYTE